MRFDIEQPKLNKQNSHFGNRYADLGEVLRVVNAYCDKARSSIEQTVRDGVFETTLRDCEGNPVETVSIPFVLGKQEPQGVGSALTYYRRYGLCLLFQLVAEEDDDGNATRVTAKKTKKTKTETKDEVEW